MGRSPHPAWQHWKPSESAPGPWRNAATDPPPDPPTVVAWLERRIGEPDGHYQSRVDTGALADYSAPALPNL